MPLSRNNGRRVAAFLIVSCTIGLAYVGLVPLNFDVLSANVEAAAIINGSPPAPAQDASPLPGNEDNAAANA